MKTHMYILAAALMAATASVQATESAGTVSLASQAYAYSQLANSPAMQTAWASDCSSPWYTFSLIEMGTCMAMGEW
ncbi:hypothetical protein [Paraburkholderia bannensis]|uniref:hypothetical protein n=1 Tax=Paraburkholderia bannensis TaxID=765414 RepID=UPI002AB2BBC2|nr:hypothetical protein [Paraburkholderia bannensis]